MGPELVFLSLATTPSVTHDEKKIHLFVSIIKRLITAEVIGGEWVGGEP